MGYVKIYMDCCCLNRPYDDLCEDAVRMEAEAILSIIDKCESGEWEFYSSDVLFDEIEDISDLMKKQKVLLLYRSASRHISLTEDIIARAKMLERYSIKAYDALHLASAEAGGANVFLTTDRKLISASGRSAVAIKVKNPLLWLTEVLYG